VLGSVLALFMVESVSALGWGVSTPGWPSAADEDCLARDAATLIALTFLNDRLRRGFVPR
jgi:hypothetical protein